jgi:hypothetical protein
MFRDALLLICAAELGYSSYLLPCRCGYKTPRQRGPLGKECLFLLEKHKFPARAHGCEESIGVEIGPLPGSCNWAHGWLTLK